MPKVKPESLIAYLNVYCSLIHFSDMYMLRHDCEYTYRQYNYNNYFALFKDPKQIYLVLFSNTVTFIEKIDVRISFRTVLIRLISYVDSIVKTLCDLKNTIIPVINDKVPFYIWHYYLFASLMPQVFDLRFV